MEIAAFNALPTGEAAALVGGCLGVQRWVDEVVGGRPYVDTEALHRQAHDAALHLSDEELGSALSRHPRIGERRATQGAEAQHSRSEQSGVRDDDAERLRVGNATYEARFGHVFLIRAAGRGSVEILAELDRRLGNDEAAEREETVTALRDIALLRLEKVVSR